MNRLQQRVVLVVPWRRAIWRYRKRDGFRVESVLGTLLFLQFLLLRVLLGLVKVLNQLNQLRIILPVHKFCFLWLWLLPPCLGVVLAHDLERVSVGVGLFNGDLGLRPLGGLGRWWWRLWGCGFLCRNRSDLVCELALDHRGWYLQWKPLKKRFWLAGGRNWSLV